MECRFRIKANVECRVLGHDQEELCIARPGIAPVINLQEGTNFLSFVSTENPQNAYSILCEVLSDDSDHYLEVHLPSEDGRRLEGNGISRTQKRSMGMNLACFLSDYSQLDRDLRVGYYKGTEPQYYSDNDYCQEYILRSRLSSSHSYNSALFTICPWETINDMLIALVRYDQYDMPYPSVSFSQIEWENVTRDGIDYRLLKRMLKDNLLIMKVLLTALSIKESNNEYELVFKTMPGVRSYMDYALDARYNVKMSVMTGVIETNRLYYDDRSNTFQSFWPSFFEEKFILNAIEDRYQFMEFPLLFLDEDERVRQFTHELKILAEST